MPSQQIAPLEPIVPNSTQSYGTTPQGSFPSIGVSPNPFPPRTIPPGHNYLGEVPTCHYLFGRILFLFPP